MVKKSGFQSSVESNFAFALVLLYYALWLVKKNAHRFLNQWEAKPEPIVPRSHAFSRAWCRLHAFASASDWSFVLFRFFVFGQSNCFGFGFTTLIENRS